MGYEPRAASVEDELRVARLPFWAQVGIIGRCALRVVPFFMPGAVVEVGPALWAATALGWIAVDASLNGSRERRALADAARGLLPSGNSGGSSASARRCIETAARAATTLPIGPLTYVAESVDAYAAVFLPTDTRQDRLVEAFHSDLSQIEGLKPERGEAISFPFFSRPLWRADGEVPQEVLANIEEWQLYARLHEVQDVAELYAELCRGGELTPATLAAHIDRWENAFTVKGKATRQAHAPHDPAPTNDASTEASQVGQPDAAVEAEPSTPPSRPPDVWMLSDQPLEGQFSEQDRFQFSDYAVALATILDHDKTGTPFTMAINAPWGAGKTTLANMIAEQLVQRPRDRGEAPHIICRFNAWMHDDATNLATAFVCQVSRTADLHRSRFRRVVDPLPAALLEQNVRQRRRLIVLSAAFATILAASWWIGGHLEHVDLRHKYEAAKMHSYEITETVLRDGEGRNTSGSLSTTETRSRSASPAPPEPAVVDSVDPILAWLQSRLLLLGAFATALAGLFGLFASLFTSTPLAGFVQSPDKAAEAGTIQAAEKQLKKLIKQATWRGNKFVVFVDDIERCRPPHSVDVLDAVNQLMDHTGVLVVLLGDMSAVAAAAQLKYKDLAEIYVPSAGIALTAPDRGKEAFGRLYLQKIVQFQFDLPIPPKAKIREYMSRLAITPEVSGGSDGASAA